ncbi:UPF0246 protein YaaA [Rhodovulum sp. P5]|nr:UPF0246 protein YaaA [Rhodovulum sp. P5]
MKVSPAIAELNAGRFAAWSPNAEGRQAAGDMFDGDAFKELELATLDEFARAEAARRLRILSGLYGLLRPTDAVCAYRLEMGRKLPGHPAGTLYAFWGTKIAEALVADAADVGTKTILNLASEEYASAIDRAALGNLSLISPRFEEERGGVRKVIAVSAKRARGAMARWVLENGVTESADLTAFTVGGYAFDPESAVDRPVFVRG